MKPVATVREIDFMPQGATSFLHISRMECGLHRAWVRVDAAPEYRDNLGFHSQDGDVHLNEPQIWTLIGVFAAFMLGSLTMVIRQNDRMITSVRSELDAKFSSMDAKFSSMDAKSDARFEALDAKFDARFESMDARFATMDARFETLDARLSGVDAKFEARFDAMDSKLDSRLGAIDGRLEDLDKEVANLATRFWGSR